MSVRFDGTRELAAARISAPAYANREPSCRISIPTGRARHPRMRHKLILVRKPHVRRGSGTWYSIGLRLDRRVALHRLSGRREPAHRIARTGDAMRFDAHSRDL